MEKLIKSTTSLLSLSSSRKISIKHYKSIISILFIISLILIILTTTITVKYDLEKFTPFTTTISTTSNKPFKPFKPSSPKQQDKLQQEIDQHQLDNNNNNKGNKKKDKRIIIFPNNFPLIKDDQLVKYYTEIMNQALNPQDLIYRNRFDYKIPQFSYSTQQFELFSDDINNNNEQSSSQCSKLSNQINIKTSRAINKNGNLRQILTRFLQDDGPYFQEFSPFFPNLKEQLQLSNNNDNNDDDNDDIIKKHWYQFIGSTVWLQQYGVHLMISRIIYTEKDQGLPIISLAYLQLFDRNWNELNDVELIIPDPKSNSKPNYNKDNNNNKENNDKQLKYKSIIYPYFAPIPIYHNIKQLKKNNGRQFYGVEDPRIILIQNEFGYEEPIIIYNSHHRKISKIDHDNNHDNDQEGKINFKNYRSLFIGWLWQTQIGKFNLEQLSDIDYSKKNEYIKIKQLTRPNNQQNLIEKNWSLFLNHQEKLIDGYHSFIYFIYQFKNLKILKCPITTTTTNNNKENDNDNDNDNGCQWEYQIHDDNKFDSGYLHGGTELININEILENYLSSTSTISSSSSSSSIFGNGKQLINSIKDKLPSNRQLWIGFARAAMKNCGCGEKMYRPNMVILIKDTTTTTTTTTTTSTTDSGFGFGESKYKLTHVSSFMDLGIEILPWWEDQGLCKGNNVVIPNGISSWTIENENENEIESKLKSKSKLKVNNLMDYLILTITRRDATIDLVYIKGLLNALLSLNPNHNNNNNNNNNNNQINGGGDGDGIGKSSIFKSSIFFHGNLINDDDDSNINKNIDCALQYSHKYCQIYGETLKIEDEFQNKEKQKEKDKGSE
ncbi:conserved hypothetical protein [Candida dubliniensis CD36]|uniref:Beta-mannosyltransferase n=1 Tax=Candida dubliniensis (strain CD36 / ATCC MYA-646 / CBS 7987 / NCPF 3949 / NRRL Y-17841) TaxID=573826 RepID=B9WFI1_CANDC|nr:conserved hypothetical protein [Candida dubliniensis CD36]CAX42000.1 conserved hypothetical protein [Candida dubliniensis CD36]